MIKPSILPGFEELLPKEQMLFDEMARTIRTTYERNGLLALDTPIIEKAEVLLAKSEGETQKQVYRFTKGKHDLALRFDLTVPFARYVSQHYNELTFPFKRYQIGKVYRGEKSQKGRYREFYQCDIDVVGKDCLSITNDAWIISIMAEVLMKLKLPDFQIKLSNRKIITGLLQALNISDPDEVMTLIDKYKKIGYDQFMSELTALTGSDNAARIANLIAQKGEPAQILEKLRSIYEDTGCLSQEDENLSKESNDLNQESNHLNTKSEDFSQKKESNSQGLTVFKAGIDELETVIIALELFGVPGQVYQISLEIIRGLDYYTGTIFETELTGYEEYGSICSGGRYDHLTELYSANRIQGFGASIGLTRLFYVLREIHFFDEALQQMPSLDYLVVPIGNTLKECVGVSKQLRSLGYHSNIYLEEDSLKKILAYANKSGVRYIILLGEDEVKQNTLTIKDMKKGNSITIDAVSLKDCIESGYSISSAT